MAGYIGPAPVPQATQNREAFTATSGQTSFATAGYTPQFIDVYLNGVKLAAADYTATNGSDVVLASGAASGDILEVVAFSAFTVADQAFTGTTTAANLTVTGAFTSQGIDDNADAVAITIDSSENVGIGTSSPNAKLDVRGAIRLGTTVPDVADGGRPIIYASDGTGSHTGHALVVQARDGAGSEIDFVTGTTPTTRMRIDSSGNVGIGASPSTPLHIKDSNGGLVQTIEAGDSSAAYTKYINSTTGSGAFTDGFLVGLDTDESATFWLYEADHMKFGTNNSEAMRIDSSGNLLVGKTSGGNTNTPGFEVQQSGFVGICGDGIRPVQINRQTSDGDIIEFRKDGSTVGSIASVGGSDIKLVLSSDGDQYITGNAASNYMTFSAANAERMRIDSSGNLLVGTTLSPTSLNSTSSEEGMAIGGDGLVVIANDGQSPLVLNRLSSDGNILNFNKDGASVGSIGVVAGDNLYIGSTTSGHAGIGFGSNEWTPMSPVGTNADNTVNIGASSRRIKNIYLSGGVYLGGTGSANKLDDYEEGTWTPTMAGYSGVTYGTRVGYYTKVGRMIMANFKMDITSIGTYGGNTHIGGFPFSVGISQTPACGVQLTVMTALNETRNEHYGALYNGGSGFFIYNNAGGARNGNVHQAGTYAGTLIYMGY